MSSVTIFDSLIVIGLVLLIAVLSPAMFSRRIKRLETWFGFITSWIVLCISLLLLVGQPQESEPNPQICLLQAAMLYASPPLFVIISYLRSGPLIGA